MRNLTSRKIEAIRRIRSGNSVEDVSKALHLPKETLVAFEAECRSASDEILLHMERVLADNDRLRRLIADLLPALTAD